MYIMNSVLSCKLATSVSTSFFQIKMVNHFEVNVLFQDIEHQLQKNVFHHFLHYSFFMKSSLN